MGVHIIKTLLDSIGKALDDLGIFLNVALSGTVCGIRDIAAVNAQRGNYISFSFKLKGGCTWLEFNREGVLRGAKIL